MTLRLDDPPPPQPCTSFPIPTPQDRLEGVSIYLVGLMGSGKSTVSTLVAPAIGYNALDADRIIEKARVARTGGRILARGGRRPPVTCVVHLIGAS